MYCEGFYRSVLQNALCGYAYCCSICSSDGVAVDFEFLEVNNAFSELFGLLHENVIGKQFSQVFSAMQREQAYLTAVLQRVKRDARPLRLRIYSRARKRFLLLKVFSPQAEHFVLEIVDTSPLIQAKKIQRHLKQQLHNEELLFDAAMLAMQNTDDNQFFDRCLALIGERLAFSRVYIFQYHAHNNTMDNTHEWVAPGIAPQKQDLQGISAASTPWWDQTLQNGNKIVFRDIEDIPDEMAKAILRPQGIKSLLVVPMFIDAHYLGFVGFDECLHYRDWKQEDIDLLSSVVNVFSNYIKHKQTEKSLHAERAQLLSLFDSIQEPIYVTDMDNYEILYANKAIQQVYNRHLCGDICYEALMNLEQPCEFCTNATLKAVAYEPYVWEIYNQVLKRHYRAVDRMIKWPDGRDVRFEMAIDITDYKDTFRDLQTEKERLRVTLHSIGDGVISTNQQGAVLMMNEVAESLTAWWREEALGQPLARVFRILDEQDYRPQPDPVEQAMQISSPQHTPLHHAILLDRNGRERIVEYSASPIKDMDGDVLGVVLVFRDRTQQKKKEAEILYLSYHDPLTGLYNRTFFERELSRLNTERQLPLSVIMGDVNGLKITNDVFGHQEGDRLLQAIAQLLKDSCRSEDIIARWGGDEFVILLPQTSSAAAHEICERITRACQTCYYGRTHVSIALGYATKEDPAEDIGLVLRRAEDFMYKRKLLESKSVRSSIVASVKQTLLERDVESAEHTDRLALLSKQIGLAMGLSDNEINELEILAMLHDIGKIAISDHILKKAEPLSPEETQELQRHPEIGYRIAQSVPELAPVADCILSHHEWWNGQGYPQGLSGEAIPLPARIITIVDAYDSLITGGQKGQALPPEQALQILASGTGTQFDPAIIAIFLDQMSCLC
ncbi:MAG: HD domain-containing phosphohydrolase [Syntrophomonadaceae bacterium]